MSSSTNNRSKKSKVEVFHLINRLKAKLGMEHKTSEEPGYIDPEAIAETDRMIEKLSQGCPEAMAAHLEEIIKLWDEMKDMNRSNERDDISQKIFTLAHEIKDLGDMCGHTLASSFAESLRDYIMKTELELEAHRIITQAHIDALQVVIKQDLKNNEDSAAEELKQMVKIAIDKYS